MGKVGLGDGSADTLHVDVLFFLKIVNNISPTTERRTAFLVCVKPSRVRGTQYRYLVSTDFEILKNSFAPDNKSKFVFHRSVSVTG